MRPIALLAVVCVASLGDGCIAVQTHTIADVVVETARGHEHVAYEAWESHNITAIALGCVLTATFYGGACWAYLATPFDEHEAAALEAAQREVAALGGCAHVVSARTTRVSWDLRARYSRMSTLRGDVFTPADVALLCTRRSTTLAPAATPAPPSPPAAPPAPSPPAPRPRDPVDPADP